MGQIGGHHSLSHLNTYSDKLEYMFKIRVVWRSVWKNRVYIHFYNINLGVPSIVCDPLRGQ